MDPETRGQERRRPADQVDDDLRLSPAATARRLRRLTRELAEVPGEMRAVAAPPTRRPAPSRPRGIRVRRSRAAALPGDALLRRRALMRNIGWLALLIGASTGVGAIAALLGDGPW